MKIITIQADELREGDTIAFEHGSTVHVFHVETVETAARGRIKVRCNDDTATLFMEHDQTVPVLKGRI
jgi:translation elongation factor P/translation initiation factor 5A